MHYDLGIRKEVVKPALVFTEDHHEYPGTEQSKAEELSKSLAQKRRPIPQVCPGYCIDDPEAHDQLAGSRPTICVEPARVQKNASELERKVDDCTRDRSEHRCPEKRDDYGEWDEDRRTDDTVEKRGNQAAPK